MLTNNNLGTLKQAVAEQSLPKKFQDAINICRRLGVLHIWIDSLCIIQDSEEDWRIQASMMADIYENAFFTVGAASSIREFDGCYSIAHAKYRSQPIPGFSGLYLRADTLLGTGSFEHVSPALLKRAWVFQEQRLSRRMLFFCDFEVTFECKSWTKTENGFNQELTTLNEHMPLYWLDGHTFSSLQTSPQLLWYRTVTAYSSRNLTLEKDRFAALAGLAKRAGVTRGDDAYLAGLWRKTLPFDLLWQTNGCFCREYKTTGSRAPSWSWVSRGAQVIRWRALLDGQPTRPPENFTSLTCLRITNVDYGVRGETWMAEVTRSAITMRAPLIKLRLLKPVDRVRRSQLSRASPQSDYLGLEITEDQNIEWLSTHSPARDLAKKGSGLQWFLAPDYCLHCPLEHAVRFADEVFFAPVVGPSSYGRSRGLLGIAFQYNPAHPDYNGPVLERIGLGLAGVQDGSLIRTCTAVEAFTEELSMAEGSIFTIG
jgi:Heterokaryon incompatibility protein (HET)